MNLGFTLVETLIVIAILSVLTAMFLGYNKFSVEQLSLHVDREKFIGVLQKAKSMGLKKYAVSSNVCAYGVHWSGNSRDYFIYEVVSSTKPCGDYEFDSSDRDNYVKVQDFKLNNKNVFLNSGDAYFVPPYFVDTVDTTTTIKSLSSGRTLKIKISGSSIYSVD